MVLGAPTKKRIDTWGFLAFFLCNPVFSFLPAPYDMQPPKNACGKNAAYSPAETNNEATEEEWRVMVQKPFSIKFGWRNIVLSKDEGSQLIGRIIEGYPGQGI